MEREHPEPYDPHPLAEPPDDEPWDFRPSPRHDWGNWPWCEREDFYAPGRRLSSDAPRPVLPVREAHAYLLDLRRLRHDERCGVPDCQGGAECELLPCGCPRVGRPCRCGCKTTVVCPGGDLCFDRLLHLTGRRQTEGVRAWMGLGLCVCPLVIQNRKRNFEEVGRSHRAFTLASGNWSARRRAKLRQCPCGAYFSEEAVAGLRSESQWRRLGYPRLLPGEANYIDPDVALYHLWCRGKPYTHKRTQLPRARIWRAFYHHKTARYIANLYSVDLFGFDQVDQSKCLLTAEQCLQRLSVFPDASDDLVFLVKPGPYRRCHPSHRIFPEIDTWGWEEQEAAAPWVTVGTVLHEDGSRLIVANANAMYWLPRRLIDARGKTLHESLLPPGWTTPVNEELNP
jgi:hypothetical protein